MKTLFLALVALLALPACKTTTEPAPATYVKRVDGTGFYTNLDLTGVPGDEWTCTYFVHVEGHSTQLDKDIILEAFLCNAPCPEDAAQMALESNAALIRHWLPACGPLPTRPPAPPLGPM